MSTQRPSVTIVDTDPDGHHDGDNKPRTLPTRRHSVDHTGEALLMHMQLPRGSSAFQEVMAELSPQQEPQDTLQPEPRPPRRRRSTQVHVHYVTETVMENGHRVVKIKSETEQEGEDLGGHQNILHGRCHCYFVRNGKVAGLADHQCQHEHRNHIYPIAASSAAVTPSTLQSSPKAGSRKLSSAAPATSPDGSPRNRRKSQQHLLTTGQEGFRARSHSDVSSLTSLVASRKFSLSSNTGHRKASEYGLSSSPRGGRGGSPERRLSHIPRTSSFRNADSVEDSDVVTSLGVERSQQAPRRKLSTHAVPSDQLHFLYDQFLSSENAGGSDVGRPRASTLH